MSAFKGGGYYFEKALPIILLIISTDIAQSHGQACNSDAISKVIFTDLTSLNAALVASVDVYGDASVTDSGMRLTNNREGSYGGIFLKAPLDFQGTGGFSLKFGIEAQLSPTPTTGTWELIITTPFSKEVLPAPFGTGSSSHGRAGWSRRNALVIEIDTYDSGIQEQDQNSNHIMVLISGSQICTGFSPPSLSAGGRHVVWVDYDGFATLLQIRIGNAGSSIRPVDATLSCAVDIWGLIPISSANQIGFAAYSDPKSSGSEHFVVDILALADAYRPYDSPKCESYAFCAARNTDTMQCVRASRGPIAMCEVEICDPNGFVWDVTGTSCCAFVEKGAWVVSPTAGEGPFEVGLPVACFQKRKILAYLSRSENCPGISS